MAAQQKKIFTSGMNSDISDELLPEGQDRKRLNVRVLSSDNNTVGAVETVKGNILKNNPLLPTANGDINIVIGSKEDLIREKIYYFIYNANNTGIPDHSIWEYDVKTDIILPVLINTELNFKEEHLITSVNFVEIDKDNHLMYWTDGFNEPRKINIEKGKLHSSGNFTDGYNSPFDISWIARIKKPPTRPTYSWANDAAIVVNNLFNKNYQFKAAFVYDDNEVSAYSPMTIYRYPRVDYVENNADDNYTQDNKIQIGFDTGSSIVKKIRIAAKETNETDFYLIAELDKEDLQYADNSAESIDFLNDGLYLPIEVNESIKLFDNVPLLSQTHDIIAGNRLADGNITEGFDPVDIDMRMDLGFQTVDNYTPTTGGLITKNSYLKSGGTYNYGIVYYDENNRSGTTNINSGLYNEIQPNNRYGTTLKIPFLTEPAYTPQKLNSAAKVEWNIFNEAPSWATHYQIVRSKNTAISKFFQFVAQSVEYYDEDLISIDPTQTIPPPPKVPIQCNINIANIIGRYKTEYPDSKLVYDFTEGDRIRIISNAPWTITVGGYGFPGTSTTYGALLNDVVNVAYNEYEVSGFNPGNQTVTFKFGDGVVEPFIPFLPGCLFEIYTPAKKVDEENQIMYEIGELHKVSVNANGFYVHEGQANNQILVTASSGTAAGTNMVMTVPSGHGIVATDNIKVTDQSTGDYGYGVVTGVTATTITIDTTTGVNWTGGAVIGIALVSKSAFGTFNSGDSFRPYQNMPFLINRGNYPSGAYSSPTIPDVFRWYAHVENMDVNNFFNSEQWDYARPNKIDSEFKRINRKSTIIYSEKFIPSTNINGLSSVFDTSFEEYQQKFGGIYKLYAEDQSLLMFQELKIGNIPVQQTIYNDLQGGTTVGASAVVLNSQAIYYSGEFGIGTNPESFAVYGKAKYGIDVKRGVVWRLSIDGLTPISETAFMSNYFTDKCELILRSKTIVDIYGGYDSKFNEYVIAFDGFTYLDNQGGDVIVPSECLAFNEKENAWSTFYSYHPETIARNGINIVTFKDGELYSHNQNPLYANFYGVQYYPEIHSVLNLEPSKVKVFEAISQETNDAWEVFDITTPNGQKSSLIKDDFQEKENNQYAFVKRDENTPNVVAFPTILPNALFEGDVMRDRTFLCKFKYNETVYNKLNALNLYVIPSDRSNK